MIHKLSLSAEGKENITLFYDADNSGVFNESMDITNPSSTNGVSCKEFPKSTGKAGISHLRILLGNRCNYSCSYCRQDHTQEPARLNDLQVILNFIRESPEITNVQNLQIWGGEPLVYWKVLKPLIEFIRSDEVKHKFRNSMVGMVTNGSLLTKDKVDFFIENRIFISVSHDGQMQHLRKSDPFLDNLYLKTAIKRLHAEKLTSINPILHPYSPSRAELQRYFSEKLGVDDLMFGEAKFSDPYDKSEEFTDFQEFARQIQNGIDDIFAPGVVAKFSLLQLKISQFSQQIATGKALSGSPQSCGIDQPTTMTIDLEGNVISCQNVVASQDSALGGTHKVGHVNDLASVDMHTAITHFSDRPHCLSCPIVQICKGGCAIMDEEMYLKTCRSKVVNYLPVLFSYFFHVTGGYNITHINDVLILDGAWRAWR